MYLSMLMSGFEAEASSFLEVFREDFQPQNKDAIEQLEGVRDARMFDNAYVQQLLTHQFVISLSEYAHQLLFYHVKLNKLIIVLSILNRNISFKSKCPQIYTAVSSDRAFINSKYNTTYLSNSIDVILLPSIFLGFR